jgi:type VI secretion system protein ImpM
MNDTLPLLYFGKLPSRGDFVRSTVHPALIQSLDRWLSSGVELMAEDAHWKTVYDQADPAHFALVSPHRHTAVVGHIVPSADLSGRRFPFVAGAAVENESGADLMALGPLMFRPTWLGLGELAAQARRADEASVPALLASLGQAQAPQLCPGAAARAHYQRFLEHTTVATLVQDLSGPGAPLDVRQLLLALGLLLQPVMNSVGQPIEKGLCLPLPADEGARFAVATFWMDVITRFLARSQYDLTLFMPRAIHHRPCLLLGFSAGAAHVLQGLLDARVTDQVFISLNESPWVEDYVANDYALKKFSSYLLMPEISLAQVMNSFQEAFLGS